MANKNMSKALSDLYSSTDKNRLLPLSLGNGDKYVIFSDLHRGLHDTADDFREGNFISYSKALVYYFKQNYNLILLGDVEELEEQQNIKKVMDAQHDPIQLERNFHMKGRFFKIFGNHDDKWRKAASVREQLIPYFEDINVFEGILFSWQDNLKIIVTHGHQGSLISDRIPFLEKFLVPYKWTLNLLNIRRKTLYIDLCSVGNYEQDLYDWVKEQERLILICGHTHRPIWGAKTHAQILKEEIDALRNELQDIADRNHISLSELIDHPARYNADIQVIRLREKIKNHNKRVAENGMCRLGEKYEPIYFNTGCCIFEDGDITGIEVEDNRMSLVKWTIDKKERNPIILETSTIKHFYDEISN